MAKTIIGRNLPLYKGEYSSATVYDRFDVVLYDGSSYVSKLPNNQNKPVSNTTYWQLLAQRGEFTEQQLEDFKAEVVAESKEEMDDYTDAKKSVLDSYTNAKKSDLDTYEGTKETELNTYTGTKKTELDTYTGGLKTDFNDNATAKTTAFNTNASDKTTAFDNNASSKTTAFDNNATAKTTAFDEHVDDKIDEFDEHTEEMQQEIDELSANMPWANPNQATSFDLTDCAKYSRNRMKISGNTSQNSYTGYNIMLSPYQSRETTTQYSNILYNVDTGNKIQTNKTYTISVKGNPGDKYRVTAGQYGVAETAVTFTLDSNGIGIATFTTKNEFTQDSAGVISNYSTDNILPLTNICIAEGTYNELPFEPYVGRSSSTKSKFSTTNSCCYWK